MWGRAQSHGAVEFTAGVWRTSKGTAAGLSGLCPTEMFPGLPCLTRWDMAKEIEVHPSVTGERSTGDREG